VLLCCRRVVGGGAHNVLICTCGRQSSGVAVDDNCVDLFNELKLKHTMKYIIYNMDDAMSKIQVRLLCYHCLCRKTRN
jgi:hypothetical protein